MKHTDVRSWLLSICTFRRSQIKTLSVLVYAAMETVRLTLAELGRTAARQRGQSVKHCIKRADRFLGNGRIEPGIAMSGWIRWLARPGRRVLVSMDWVDIRQWHCVVLAARFRGRAIPLLWAVYRPEELHKSQNNLEYGLLRLLRCHLPDQAEVVILADRGFGRTEMARECQKLGFDYIIRIVPDVWIDHPEFRGKLLDLPLRRGTERILRNAAYRKNRPVQQHVAVLWPARQAQPWFLMTNVPKLRARCLSRIYGRRMSIEEYFRDAKSKRNGYALRLTMIQDQRRLERLLLVLAMAYWLLMAVGLYAQKAYPPSRWCTNKRTHECSLFTIGRFLFMTPLPGLFKLMRELRKELSHENWG
jgi:hypothetical protein